MARLATSGSPAAPTAAVLLAAASMWHRLCDALPPCGDGDMPYKLNRHSTKTGPRTGRPGRVQQQLFCSLGKQNMELQHAHACVIGIRNRPIHSIRDERTKSRLTYAGGAKDVMFAVSCGAAVARRLPFCNLRHIVTAGDASAAACARLRRRRRRRRPFAPPKAPHHFRDQQARCNLHKLPLASSI